MGGYEPLMAVIKLVEEYAVRSLRKDVRDSLMMAGEQCILLQLYHAGESDAVPCPECGDDIYDSAEANCTSCYGTTFDKGVRHAQKVWALFNDKTWLESLGARGTYIPDARGVQFEAFPQVLEHDVLVRVVEWAADRTPAQIEAFYELGTVVRRSLRTGNRFGQSASDVVAQKAAISALPANAPIAKYPVIGRDFPEWNESADMRRDSIGSVPLMLPYIFATPTSEGLITL